MAVALAHEDDEYDSDEEDVDEDVDGRIAAGIGKGDASVLDAAAALLSNTWSSWASTTCAEVCARSVFNDLNEVTLTVHRDNADLDEISLDNTWPKAPML